MDTTGLVAAFEAQYPLAARLAEVACLAARVEPHYLRALRQQFVGEAYPGCELELWHGPLANGRGVDAFAFDPDVLQQLRERLAKRPRAFRERVLAITRACYQHHPEIARDELELNAAPVVYPGTADARIADVLERVRARQRNGGDDALAVARWLLHAAPRLHPRVLAADPAWMMLMHASATLGGRRLLSQSPPATLSPNALEQAGPLPDLPTRPIGIELLNGWLGFRSPLLAGAKIEVPVVSPSVVVVRDQRGGSWTVEATPGSLHDVGGAAVVTVQTLAGDLFHVSSSRQRRGGGGPLETREAMLLMRVSLRDAKRLGFELSERDAQGAVADANTRVQASVGVQAVLGELIALASNDASHDAQIRATLHHLLIPREIEHLLGGASETWLRLDEACAAIPWELLDRVRTDIDSGTRPWAIRAKLLRTVASATPAPARGEHPASVLVVGDPGHKLADYPMLPGARMEARAVAAQFQAQSGSSPDATGVRVLGSEDDAKAVFHALQERAYRVVHVTGHGRINPASGSAGIVLSDAVILGPSEFATMKSVPDLVFINSGHTPEFPSFVAPYDRVAFAARLARELLATGVRCVVITGGLVQTEPAVQFAGTLYQMLLAGERFIDAVAVAREAAWRSAPEGNTWAAYQCWGDPDWRWQGEPADDDPDDADEVEAIASPVALIERLASIAERASTQLPARPRLARQALALETRHASAWGGMGRVAEAFGAAYGALEDDDRALQWYSAAIAAADSSASFRSAQRGAWHRVRHAERQADTHLARQGLFDAIAPLRGLLSFQRNAELEYRLASVLQTVALLDAPRASRSEVMKALLDAHNHFDAAQSLLGEPRAAWAFDAGRQQLAGELWMVFYDGKSRAADRASFDTQRIAQKDMARNTGIPALDRLEMKWFGGILDGRLFAAADPIVAELERMAGDKNAPPAPLRLRAATFTLELYGTAVGGDEAVASTRILNALRALGPGMAGAAPTSSSPARPRMSGGQPHPS